MTAPIDHRAMAERCMDRASKTEESDREASWYWLQRAQVHATLALSNPPAEFQVVDAADVDLSTTLGLLELRQLVRDYLAARRVNDLSAAFLYLEQLADMVEEDES